MSYNLNPYPAYKDSGVPWLGNLPQHWEVRRLGALLRERGETNDDLRVIEVLSVLRDRGVIPYADKGNIGNKKSDDITRYKIVRPNDIVVNCMNVIIGSVGLSKYTGCLSPVYYVLTRREERDNPRYLNAYFQTQPFQRSLVRIGNGILAHRMRIPMELLKSEPFPRPPAIEQSAIVRFLTHVDRNIQRAIRAKQKLIKLLEEQKQVLIHRAVTGQIDVRTGKPYPAYKPSGVEWLRDVPGHWDITPLGRCLRKIEQGWSPVAAEGDLVPGQWAVLSLSAVKRGHFIPTAIKPIPIASEVPGNLEIRDGDLLLTRSNTRELVGDVCLVEGIRERTLLCDLIYRLAVDLKSLVPRFAMYQLLSSVGRRQIEQDARGSSGTMPKIAQRHIRSWKMVVPSLPEQAAIINAIASGLARSSAPILQANREISLLREYRTRLVADVVTGKLDVREAAARLPAEPEAEAEAAEPEDALDLSQAAEEAGAYDGGEEGGADADEA